MSDRLQSCPGCGCVLSNCPECGHALIKGRSRPDHNRLFAMIDAAYHHWPEGEEFRDVEQFRAYLLVRAGHFDVAPVDVPEGYAEDDGIRRLYRVAVECVARAFSGKSGYYKTRVSAGAIEVLTARSISYETVKTQKEFGPIRDAVESLIEQVVGVPANQLLRERSA